MNKSYKSKLLLAIIENNKDFVSKIIQHPVLAH